MELSDREERILSLASGMLDQLDVLDEKTIDAFFIFHFDPIWCEQIERIRQMMAELLGKTSAEPFSMEEGARIITHLSNNACIELVVRTRLYDMSLHKFVEAETKPEEGRVYRCLDSQLREIFSSQKPRFDDEQIRLMQQHQLEKDQEEYLTRLIQQEIIRLAQLYHLVPLEGEIADWTPRRIRDQLMQVVQWIVYGDKHAIAPAFPPDWQGVVLLEGRLKDSIARTVRPWKEQSQDDDSPKARGRGKAVRVRTWSFYYMTNRGGGKRPELEAQNILCKVFPELRKLESRNLQRQRDNLFVQLAR